MQTIMFSCSLNNPPGQFNFKHMEIHVVIIDATGPWKWLTAGKVVTDGKRERQKNEVSLKKWQHYSFEAN